MRFSRRRKAEQPAAPFDFRRPDRIPKSQVRAIHLPHDTLVRNLVSSLSADLRSYLTVNLVSVEQLSYAEFLEGLPSPTCNGFARATPLRWQWDAGTEPDAGLSRAMEMVLGGTGKSSAPCSGTLRRLSRSSGTG